MKTKVLMFGWEFPPHIAGGLGTACLGLTRGLAKQGVEVLFVMPKASGDEDQSAVKIINASDVEMLYHQVDIEEYWNNINFMEVGSNLIPYMDPESFEREVSEQLRGENREERIGFKNKYQFSGKYGANLMEEVARYALVAATIAKEQTFDVIHAHDWLTYAAGIAAKKVSGKPLVIHVHATEFDRSGENVNGMVFDLERKGMLAADRVITVSNLTRNIVITKYGINPDKVFTVHNAVDFQSYSEMDVERGVKEKVVTFLGRITYQKGPEYFVEMAKRLLDFNSNVRFIIGGNGDRLVAIKKRVKELGMDDKFLFTGFLDKKSVQEVFSITDVYVMPSVSEPFGISPLEAMLCNVPVVLSKQSGVAEVIKNVIKVDYWDIDSMANAVYGILSYPELYNYMTTQGKEEAKSVKWSNAAQRLTSLYRKLGK